MRQPTPTMGVPQQSRWVRTSTWAPAAHHLFSNALILVSAPVGHHSGGLSRRRMVGVQGSGLDPTAASGTTVTAASLDSLLRRT
jgi:hypothetical protein